MTQRNSSGPVASYQDLLVWQKSMDLTVKIYEVTTGFPAEEKFGLISQMRRAASSIPANIAEGQARRTTREFLQFLAIARGSLAELETFIVLSERLELLKAEMSQSILSGCTAVGKMLSGLSKSLAAKH